MKRTGKNVLLISLLFFAVAAAVLVTVIIFNTRRESDYLQFRAEGLSFSEASKSAVSYLGKYYYKRLGAADSIVKHFREQQYTEDSLMAQPAGDTILTMAFVGDIMWIRNGWDTFLDPAVKSYLEKYDLVFGNLETPVDTTAEVPSFLPDYRKYNSAPGLINSFRKQDNSNIFTALSLANNHVLDMGREGLEMTSGFLEKSGILISGINTNGSAGEYLIIEKNGIRIGLYSAGWGLNNPDLPAGENAMINIIPGIAPLRKDMIDLNPLKNIIRDMEKENIDIKILSLHWGYEFELYPDPEIIRAGRELAGCGADLVIGSHSHIIQPAEIIFSGGSRQCLHHKTFIAYSLGNFVTAMYTPLCRLGVIRGMILFRNESDGTIDWKPVQPEYVYNTPAAPGSKGRKLMFWDEYISALQKESPLSAGRIRRETAHVFRLRSDSAAY
jgi:poly-gamma-glutamate synthesis protein (capsule biosynthesis protein)